MASRWVSTYGDFESEGTRTDEVEFRQETAQWAVFRNSPEGFSLRDRGARSASMSPVVRSSLYCAVLTNGAFSFEAT